MVKQRFDRGYNLTHNFSGEESVHGQVALAFVHGGRMGPRTTVLHAHHMKDWSMFKSIVSLEDPGYLAAHPIVEFIHESTRYTACWCECFLHVDADGNVIPPVTPGARWTWTVCTGALSNNS